MDCPRCKTPVSDGSWRCDRCGAIFGTPNAPDRNGFHAPASRAAKRMSLWLGMLVLVAGLGVAALFVFKPGAHARAANAGTPGEEADVREFLAAGKLNIVDFFSEYCPPCRLISPRLEKLAAQRPDVAVIKLDINRPGVKGIDWMSPLARQYKLESIPHFQIWDGGGKLVAEGDAASNQVMVMLAQLGLND